jgi:hypothetical protein
VELVGSLGPPGTFKVTPGGKVTPL